MNTDPNLYIGLGSAVYALVKADGHLQSVESLRARMVLIEQPHGDLAMQSFILREHYDTAPEEAYTFALRCFVTNRKALSKNLKRNFVALMQRVAESDQQVSGKEVEFIERFRRDIQQL
ncbi:MAG: TerB family tellurite resistance protein [Runella slithyformis]|nr:MAG: TerB family tellurite resistance protein [Runella slithyformis]TAF95698.1 MAG: TerB family tellurite resistance protein [Runella sp.]TAG19119.1 MAG: TerB family tellurite resistance protein [Cytophagales bacterium]TAG38410.1 MAG: TerB family tellurite resistance protein [Cytophagia bacterium]TAF47481.1 MAG: TerB family tellurite resistance protein [Runella slithyformis]